MRSGRKFADFYEHEEGREAHFSWMKEKNYVFSSGFLVLLNERVEIYNKGCNQMLVLYAEIKRDHNFMGSRMCVRCNYALLKLVIIFIFAL